MMPEDPIDDAAADEPGPEEADGRAPEPADRAHKDGRTVDRKLLEILVCPLTKTTLEYDAARQELISRAAKLAFPIRDGIPILLEEEARQLTDDEGRR